MTRKATQPTRKHVPALTVAAAAIVAALAAAPAVAQYKWIGPDGKVNYGDQPPPEAKQAKPVAAPTGAGGASLPWSLQQVAGKYPVTLYTSADCAPCETARKHLQSRGIPYTEKQLSKPADVEAFKALGFAEPSLPSMTVGRQRTAGFEAGAWNGLLDAAGYPAQSALPKGWQPPAAQPMVAAAPLPAPKAEPETSAPQRRAADARASAPSIAMPPAPEPGTIRF